MTEAEYAKLPGSDALPIYDSEDHQCGVVDDPRAHDRDAIQYGTPKYDGAREAVDLVDALMCADDPSFEFRGGIRSASEDEPVSIIAYFWKLR